MIARDRQTGEPQHLHAERVELGGRHGRHEQLDGMMPRAEHEAPARGVALVHHAGVDFDASMALAVRHHVHDLRVRELVGREVQEQRPRLRMIPRRSVVRELESIEDRLRHELVAREHVRLEETIRHLPTLREHLGGILLDRARGRQKEALGALLLLAERVEPLAVVLHDARTTQKQDAGGRLTRLREGGHRQRGGLLRVVLDQHRLDVRVAQVTERRRRRRAALLRQSAAARRRVAERLGTARRLQLLLSPLAPRPLGRARDIQEHGFANDAESRVRRAQRDQRLRVLVHEERRRVARHVRKHVVVHRRGPLDDIACAEQPRAHALGSELELAHGLDLPELLEAPLGHEVKRALDLARRADLRVQRFLELALRVEPRLVSER